MMNLLSASFWKWDEMYFSPHAVKSRKSPRHYWTMDCLKDIWYLDNIHIKEEADLSASHQRTLLTCTFAMANITK